MEDEGLSAAFYFRVLLYLWLVYASKGSCDQLALGLEGGFISDSKITSSSVESASTPAKNGRLNYTAGSSWCAATSETSPYLQIDLLTPHIVCAVSTQGNSKADQWVTTYKLQSSDGTSWKDYKEMGKTKTFLGNFDRNTPVKHVLHMGITAKYLRFLPQLHKGGRCVRVELYGVLQKQENLAFMKPTAQSSTIASYASKNAVDGNRGTWIGTCTHTDGSGSTNPWWRVDLGRVEPVSELFIVNRGEGSGYRLNGFEIRVANKATTGGVSNPLCGSKLSIPEGQGKSFFCDPTAYGRYVYIRLPGSGKILTLCEVEVYPTRRINRALKHPASQSSRKNTDKGFAAWAVDGNDNTDWSQNSCTMTRTENNPWWRVDLGSSVPVTDVFIVNRDCGAGCTNQFKDFEIRIGNDDHNGGTSNSLCGKGLNLGNGEKRAFICRPRRVGRYVYIRIPRNGKTLTICELKVYSGYTACELSTVGVQDRSKISDHRFSASSFRDGNEPSKGRLRGASAWVSNTNNNADDYLQIDLGSVYFVCGVATQGNAGTGEWTTKYKIKTSLNNAMWTFYPQDNKAEEFVGNNDRNSVIKRKLNQPPVAKFIRFYPVSFVVRKALRVEVYGSVESCQSSLGMEDSSLVDTKINASSRLDSSHGASFGRLYGSSSWCSSSASPSAYLQIDLGQVKTVTGVATQGNPSSDKWVTNYNIGYGYNGKTWISGAAYQGLSGNSDKSKVFVNWLSSPFAARYVKIIPQAQSNAICLRVDLYGCEHFIVPYLYVEDPAVVTLPTTSTGTVKLAVKAEFSKERPAVFTWSNKDGVLSESTSSITIRYSSAENTWKNFDCLRRSLSKREVYCNATYSCSVSLQGMDDVEETVQANVTAVLKTPAKPSMQSPAQGDIRARSTTVKWTRPSLGSDEAPIASFKLHYSNTTFSSIEHIPSSVAGSKLLTNLKPYTNYNVKVMATSILGDGPWSAIKPFKTSTAVPDVAPLVTNLTATNSRTIYVEWQKPDLDKINGPLIEYKVEYKQEGAASGSVKSVISRTSVSLQNLQIWTKYKVQVRVNNGDYDGPLSVEMEISTYQDAPSAPRDLIVSEQSPSGDRGPQLMITWKKPAQENGLITMYNLSYAYAIEDSLPINRFAVIYDVTYNYTLVVLGGVDYTVEVFAKTIKPGPKTTIKKRVGTYRPSSPPLGIQKQKINETTFNITWQPLSRWKSNGKIITYEVKSTDISPRRRKRASSTDREMFWNTSITAHVLSNLKVCTKYSVEVRAYTTAGPGSFGTIDGPIETSAPGPPTSFEELSHNETTVALRWNEPVIRGQKQTFTIACEGLKDYYPEFSDVRTVVTTATSFTVGGLFPGTKYKFSVSSTSLCGVGDNSSVLSVKTQPAAPVAPDEGVVKHVTTSETSVNVTVRSALQTNGPISFYQVIIYQVNEWTDKTVDAGNNLTTNDASGQKKVDFYITAQFTADSVKPSRHFLVGDGRVHGNFTNTELSKGKKYEVYSRALTTWNSERLLGAQRLIAQIDVKADVPDKTVSKPSSDPLSSGVIAGISIFVVCLILAGVVVAGFVWKRRRQTGQEAAPKLDQSRSLPLSNVSSNNLLFDGEAPEREGEVVLVEESVSGGQGLDGPIYSNTEPEDDSHDDPMPVPVDRFAEYVTCIRRGKDSAITKQYKRLNNGQLFSWETAKKPENRVKNRYGNIIAYDHSRVVLPHLKGDEHSDYINANYLHGFDGNPKTYIACQGPVTRTFNDFWRMIWLQKATVIVMLTRLLENNRVKCHQYWPENKEQYGNITVVNQKTEIFADYIIRTFILFKRESEERRQIHQFHFLAWPDKGVPQHATAVLGLRRKVRALQHNSKYPLLVHCSAGIGRTGTFVVIDAMLESAKRKKVVDVFNYIQVIRNDRISMVQTEEQYVFIYMAILEALTCGRTDIPAQDLRIAIKKLSAVDPKTSLSGFDSEFQRLELITSADTAERVDDAGHRPENVAKNRFPNVVPLNEARVLLMVAEDKNYINASFVDAFREQNAFITTQAPLKNTRTDFWQMVWDYSIGTVVMLNELKEQGQAYPVYWPSEGSITFDKFTLEVASHEVFHDFTERVLRLTKKGDSQTGREVRHYQVTGWPDKGAPANLQGILDLVNAVERSQRKCSRAPVVVHCSNGVGRSGTFCAVLSILERLKSEQVLDIFQAIKVLRIKRPGAVETTAQYIFCYNMVQKYLDSFDDYANFS